MITYQPPPPPPPLPPPLEPPELLLLPDLDAWGEEVIVDVITDVLRSRDLQNERVCIAAAGPVYHCGGGRVMCSKRLTHLLVTLRTSA